MTAELLLDIVIDDEVDISVVDDPVDVSVVDGEFTIVDIPGIRGPRGYPAELYSGVITGGDGQQVTFPLPQTPLNPAHVQVFRNGLAEVYGVGFTATTTEITFSTAPLDTDVIAVSYQIAEGS